MEKQPVDELFARKLREAELLPGPDTFSRLQSRMGAKSLPANRKRVVIGWYSAAASLLLIAFVLYRGFSPKQTTAQDIARKNLGKAGVSSSPSNAPNVPVALQQIRQRPLHQKHVPRPSIAVSTNKTALPVTASSPQVAVGNLPPQKKSSLAKQTLVATPEKLVNAVPIAQNQGLPTEAGITAPIRPATNELTKNLQRVVVLTIDEPVVVQPVAALQTVQPPLEKQAQPASLVGLFSKLKQLKNGDLLARATPAKQPAKPRTRLGRVFDGVKESLKNETTAD